MKGRISVSIGAMNCKPSISPSDAGERIAGVVDPRIRHRTEGDREWLYFYRGFDTDAPPR
jgi:hypothetical protein